MRSNVDLESVERIVVKVGSALLAEKGAGLVLSRIRNYAQQVASAGCEVVLVSSGAIAEGCNRLGWTVRPESVHELQAAAAVGQIGLAEAWESALRSHDAGAAMICLLYTSPSPRDA